MRWLSLTLIVVLCSACGPKLVRQPVFRNESVIVELRHRVEGGEIVSRDLDHPARIADVRIAHILAGLTFERGNGKRTPAIRSSHVYDLAEGLAQALGEATPDQEAMAVAFSRDRRFGIFSQDHVTIFACHIEEGQLILEFHAIEQSRDEDRQKVSTGREFETPAELPTTRPGFKLIPGEASARRGDRALVIDWRDPYFRKPVSLRYQFGQVRRRTILMEDEAEGEPAPEPAPGELSDAQLGALDELEAARYGGYVPESEYQRRRRLILQDKLEEAGYGDDPQ